MKFFRYLKDVFISSLPLLVVMIVVCFFVHPMIAADLLRILIGYAMVVVGQTFFLVGLDGSVLPIGKLVGGALPKLSRPVFIVLFG